MEQTPINFAELDVDPKVVQYAKSNNATSCEALLFGCSKLASDNNGSVCRLLNDAVARQCAPKRELVNKLIEERKDVDFECTVCDEGTESPTILQNKTLFDIFTSVGVVEVAGESGAGKTQLALSLAVAYASPSSAKGFNRRVVYMSTEGSFPSKRLHQMLESFSPLERETISDSIFVDHLHEITELVNCVKHKLPKLLQCDNRPRLVLIDSVAAPFRLCDGDESWVQRQEAIHSIGYTLNRLAAKHGVTFVVINQVTTKADDIHGVGVEEEFCPALGLSWSHFVSTRILLKKRPGNLATRTLTVYNCSWLPKMQFGYHITSAGIRIQSDLS